jgi:hypothetical protein
MSRTVSAAILVCLAGQALAQTRESYTAREPITPAALAQAIAAGKHIELDPSTGERLIPALRDSLPANWRSTPIPGEGRVDSFGNPIVNERAGWPAYAQRDVDALRARIAERRDAILATGSATETEHALGLLIGDAVVRGIEIDDLVMIEDLSPTAASAVLNLISSYEWTRSTLARSDRAPYSYVRSVYPARIHNFAAAHGTTVDALLNVITYGDNAIPSGCYNAYTWQAGGFRTRVNGTIIWQQNGLDDAFADIPIGWNSFSFYNCQGQSPNANSMVRVSTNGYASLFQQGGNALNGIAYVNQPIGTPGTVDGFITPSWDDYFIAVEQSPEPDHIWYETVGAVGERRCYISWQSVSKLGGMTEDLHWFQIQLDEATGGITLVLDVMTEDTDESASRGLEAITGTDGDCGADCTNDAPWDFNERIYLPAPQTLPIAPNDECENALVVLPNTSHTLDIFYTNSSVNPSCRFGADSWYSFTAPTSGHLRVSMCGAYDDANVDSMLSLFDTCDGTALACVDDPQPNAGCGPAGHGLDAVVHYDLVAGQHILIRSSTIGGGLPNSMVTTSFGFTTGGDNCSDAAALVGLSGSLIGDLRLSTPSGVAQCSPSATVPDLWYSIQNTTGKLAHLTVDTCGTSDYGAVDRGFDSILSLWDRCGAAMLTCVDDSSLPCDQGNQYDALASYAMTPGETVFIRVTSWTNDAANFVLNWNLTPCPADYNGDGGVDGDDVIAFFADWDASIPQADFNGDGGVDGDDVIGFFGAWDNGC